MCPSMSRLRWPVEVEMCLVDFRYREQYCSSWVNGKMEVGGMSMKAELFPVSTK